MMKRTTIVTKEQKRQSDRIAQIAIYQQYHCVLNWYHHFFSKILIP